MVQENYLPSTCQDCPIFKTAFQYVTARMHNQTNGVTMLSQLEDGDVDETYKTGLKLKVTKCITTHTHTRTNNNITSIAVY